MKIPSSITALLAGILLTLVSLWYGQNHGLLPIAASEEAVLVDGLFNMMMTVSTGLFILVESALIIAAFKFRRRPGDTSDGPPVHGNIPLEILWTAIPAVIILVVGVYSFEVYNAMGGLSPMEHSIAHVDRGKQMARMPGAAIAATLPDGEESRNQQAAQEANQDPATAAVREEIPQQQDSEVMGVTAPRIGPTRENLGKPPELTVNVTGLQFAWIFTYPDSGVVSGELHVPLGREVKLNMSANDVIHAFWVPQFRIKQDVIPGMQTELRFTPSKVGEYPVICAELCGGYHGAMKTRVIAHTPKDFDAWVQSQVANNDNLDRAVAVNPQAMSAADFLAPYINEIGVSPETLTQLHPTGHHVHH